MMMFFSMKDLDTLWEELNQSDEEREQEKLEERLVQRAKQYALPQRQQEIDVEEDMYNVLTFRLGEERYGLNATSVRGVRSLGRMTRVPGTPPFYRGVVNVRGRIVTVVDIRMLFGVSVDKSDVPGELLFVEGKDLYLAILAHHVEDVVTIPYESVEPVEIQHAHGVTADQLIILDIAHLLSDDRLILGGKTKS